MIRRWRSSHALQQGDLRKDEIVNLGYDWPASCGYCKCSPCQCDGHGGPKGNHGQCGYCHSYIMKVDTQHPYGCNCDGFGHSLDSEGNAIIPSGSCECAACEQARWDSGEYDSVEEDESVERPLRAERGPRPDRLDRPPRPQGDRGPRPPRS